VKASFSIGWGDIGKRQSKTTARTLHERVIVSQFAEANDGIFAGNDAALDTTNTWNELEIKSKVEERKLHRMAKVHNCLEIWQGSQNLCAKQTKSHGHNRQMTAVGYISDTEHIVKASWSNFWPDGCSCIQIVGKITCATSFDYKWPHWRRNSSIECPPNQKNRLRSSGKWWG